MAIKAVQQIMLGTVTGSEAKAKETLQAMVNAGYNGIELNSFMVNPTPFYGADAHESCGHAYRKRRQS